MKYLGQEGYLLFFDEINPEFEVGSYLASNSKTLRITYIDRELGEMGCIPASDEANRKINKLRRKYPDAFGAGDA